MADWEGEDTGESGNMSDSFAGPIIGNLEDKPQASG